MATEITSALLSDELIGIIRTHIINHLKTTSRRAINRDDICTNLKDQIGEIERSHFKQALSLSIKEGRLPEFEMKTGKAGGVGLKSSASKPTVAVVENKPMPVEKSVVTLGGREYAIRMSTEKAVIFFSKVFNLSRDPDGDFTIGDITYAIEDKKTAEYVENALWALHPEDAEEESQAA